MSEMKLEVNKELVTKAIFDSLTPEARNSLIQGAIAGLLEGKVKDRYSRDTDTTKLQDMFNTAASDAAREIVREEMKKPVVREPIARAVSAAVLKALDEEGAGYSSLIDSLAGAIASGWAHKDKDRY